MRAFLGVPLPRHESIQAVLDELRASGADLKVAAADHFHLTLNFLGEVPDSVPPVLLERLKAQPLPPPFEVALRDVGAFPNWKRPRVLWAGIEDPSGGLSQLYVAAQRAWVELGHVGEGRDFRPHLTLARTRTDRGIGEAHAVLDRHRQEEFGRAQLDRVNCYRSTLTPKGSVYEVIGDVRL